MHANFIYDKEAVVVLFLVKAACLRQKKVVKTNVFHANGILVSLQAREHSNTVSATPQAIYPYVLND